MTRSEGRVEVRRGTGAARVVKPGRPWSGLRRRRLGRGPPPEVAASHLVEHLVYVEEMLDAGDQSVLDPRTLTARPRRVSFRRDRSIASRRARSLCSSNSSNVNQVKVNSALSRIASRPPTRPRRVGLATWRLRRREQQSDPGSATALRHSTAQRLPVCSMSLRFRRPSDDARRNQRPEARLAHSRP